MRPGLRVSHHKIMGNRYKDALPLRISRVKASTEIPVAEGGKMKPGYEEDAGFKFEIKTFREGKQIPTTASNEFVPPCLDIINTYYPDKSKLPAFALCYAHKARLLQTLRNSIPH